MSSSVLLHFGAGSLGLGLVIPEFVSSKTDTDIYVVNRNSSKEDAKSRNTILQTRRNYYTRHKIGFDDLVRINNFFYLEEDESTLLSILSQDKPIYFTTALKEGVNDEETVDKLANLVHFRSKKKFSNPLIIIACENATRSSVVFNNILTALRKKHGESYELDPHILYADSVVDRICTNPKVNESRNVILYAEPYCSWIISIDRIKSVANSQISSLIIKQLESCPHVELVDNIDFYERRKKWIINSTHQLIALYAHLYEFANIKIFLGTEEGRKILDLLTNEVLLVYLKNETYVDVSETEKYIEQLKDRLNDAYSTVDAALSRFKPGKIEDFLKDFYRKVGQPVIVYMEKTEKGLFTISYIFFKLAEMVAKKQFLK